MPTRTIPTRRMVYDRKPETGHYRLTIDIERNAFSKLRERIAAGEVDVENITWPPQIDHKGVPHVTVIYWTKRLMSEDEIDKKEQRELERIGKGSTPVQISTPAPSASMFGGLTPEERELLDPWKGPRDD